MAEQKRSYETQFAGRKGDAARTKLPPGFFQEDEGGDLSLMGAWKRRKGMRRTSIAKQSSPVVTLIGFSIGGGTFGVALAQGANLEGFTGVTQLATGGSASEGGFGETEFGEGEFGE